MKINRDDVVKAIVDFPFWDYGLDTFPVVDEYSQDPTEVVNDLADLIIERLESADSE